MAHQPVSFLGSDEHSAATLSTELSATQPHHHHHHHHPVSKKHPDDLGGCRLPGLVNLQTTHSAKSRCPVDPNATLELAQLACFIAKRKLKDNEFDGKNNEFAAAVTLKGPARLDLGSSGPSPRSRTCTL